MRKIEIPILGMTCASCALRIESNLKEIENIKDVKVNFSTERAEISIENDDFNLEKLKNEIEGLGYGILTSKVTFSVLGMSCINCAKKIEEEISKLFGVIKVNVNFAKEEVYVEYIPTLINIKDIQKVIGDLGYKVINNISLEKVLEAEREKELNTLKRRFLFSFILAIPVVLGSTVFSFNPFLLFVLTTPIQFYGGYLFYKNAVSSLKHKFFDMNVLVSIGTTASYLYSVLNTIFPSFLQDINANLDFYYDTSAVIITVVLLGRYLEKRAKERTSQAIKRLMSLKPEFALVKRGENYVEIPIEEILKGDIVLVKPSMRIPVDGEILEGISLIDESMLTGESVPKEKKLGDKVFAGTINISGVIKIIAEKIGEETFLARIIKLVEEAQNTKASIQRFVDKISNIFVPTVLIVALLTFVFWYLFGPFPSYKYALMTFVSVLVIACPCALGLATPTALVVGLGKGSEMGILIKGAEVLERVSRIDTVIFDKTGTLTYGKLKVKEIIPSGDYNQEEILNISGSLEKYSEHPIAKAIYEEFLSRGMKSLDVMDIKEIAGFGVEGKIGGSIYRIGKITDLEKVGEFSETAVGLYKENTLIGIILLEDELRKDAKEVISILKKQGFEVGMITGDREEVARKFKDILGLSFYIAEILPDGKLQKITELQNKGKKVAMIGDGINDAPSLVKADLGIAMGSGTDIAIESGDIILVNNDLKNVIRAIELSKATSRTIKWNLFWAFFYNVLGIPVAAGVLYPFWGILLNPMIAGISMGFSSVFVISNSLRLKSFRSSI